MNFFGKITITELNLAIYVDGRYLGKRDVDFVDYLKEDIERFYEKLLNNKSVLVFPPFLSKYRYLAHKIVDDYFFPELCSFSIGVEDSRRTLVGSTDSILKCSLPFKCIHEKLIYISENEGKEIDCVCSARKRFSATASEERNLFLSAKNHYGIMENVKNSFKDTTFESESSKEFQATLRDRRKRPDKQLYVPRALRTKKDCSVSENIKDGSGVSLESNFNNVPREDTKTESVSNINHCQSLRTKRKSSGCIKEELCDVEINFHDVLFKGVKTKSTNKNQCSLVRTERKSLVSEKDELSLEPCASESIFQDVPFQDAESQSTSNENCCSTLATKKDGSVFVQDEVSDSVNISNFSSRDTVNSFESTCYPPNDKDLAPKHINAVKEDICSSKMPSETFNSSIFVPDFKVNSENANIIEKEDGVHSFKDQNNVVNYSKENFISCYQPLKEGDMESKILYECKNKIYESDPKELTLEQVPPDISPDVMLVNEEMRQENGDINLNSYTSNIVSISDDNQFCDGFDNAKQICDKSAPDEDSWETMFNDEGECLDPEFTKELCKVTGRMQIHVAKNNYNDYTPISDTTSNEYDCIVELYAFPVEFKTQDLVSSLSIFQQDAYSIKWVDDCHALAIFNSPTLANQALQLSSQFVKFRPLSDGTKESKAKARLCSGQLEPCRPRPATSAVLARRLVSGALGLKDKTSKEQRALERNMLKEAKERKKLKAKQRQDIWDGVVL